MGARGYIRRACETYFISCYDSDFILVYTEVKVGYFGLESIVNNLYKVYPIVAVTNGFNKLVYSLGIDYSQVNIDL